MEKVHNTDTQKQLSFSDLWQDIKKYKNLYYKVLSITFVVSAIIMLSIPNYYKCTVMLAPELSGSTKSSGGLASLASSFGVNINGSGNGVDAIMPALYPDLMNSVAFQTSLFPITVEKSADSTHTRMTYYDYLLNEQKYPWWSAGRKAVVGWIKSLFAEEEKTDGLNPFKLTKKQFQVVKAMEKKVVCDVDQKTNVISIEVTDQDPLVAATMADSVQKHLQEFITDYRTRKARVDLEYNQKLYKETKARYEKARQLYAEYTDANQDIILQTVRQKQTDLENEMQLKYNAYTQIAAQLQLSEAKVQQETPAFTTLQPATVPVEKAGPSRVKMCLIFLFLAFFGTTIYAFHKEEHLNPLLGLR